MSKNSPEAGERVFRSIEFYKLNITRACFTSGNPHYQYLPAFNASLFLSANLYDVKEALMNNHAAGRVLNNNCSYRDENKGLIIAFDFDGVIASDKSDKVYRDLDKNMEKYHEYEDAHSAEALELDPIGGLLQKLSFFQKLEKKKKEEEPSYERLLRTAIVTARNAPAHKRVISSLKKWQVEVDEIFFLGSMGVGSKGKRERARGLMGSDFCRILPRLAPEGKGEKRGFKEGVQLPNRSPFCLSVRRRKMR